MASLSDRLEWAFYCLVIPGGLLTLVYFATHNVKIGAIAGVALVCGAWAAYPRKVK